MVGYSFVVTDGPDIGRTFVLNAGITIIGRLDTAAPDDPPHSARWTLTDPAVSRTHAQITWDGENAPVLVHLSTTNATLLNGRIVTGQSLEQGQSLLDKQSLRLGQTGLEVVVSEVDDQWKVLEDDREYGFSDPHWENSDFSFAADSHGARVTLHNSAIDAYLLRRWDGALWSTPLRPEIPVTLVTGDILRVDERRLVIGHSEG